jgi:ABC-type Fe3+/spermidine/putrescine transport system ATPase subunit
MRRDVKSILSRSGATSIFVTHDQDEAFALADRVLVLNDGRGEQLDTPDAIYHQPRTRFVGDFVGLADFLTARCDRGEVVTEVGTFPYSGDAFEGEMDLLLRPDDVDIVDDGVAEGEVIDREFRRAYNRYTIRLTSGRTIRSFQSTLAVYPMGEQVRVRVHPTHVVLFPHERRGD